MMTPIGRGIAGPDGAPVHVARIGQRRKHKFEPLMDRCTICGMTGIQMVEQGDPDCPGKK